MNVLYTLLFCAAFGLIQCLIGGTRLLFSLPAYGLLALLGILSVVSLRKPRVLPNRLCLLASALFFGYVLVRGLFSPVAYLAWTDVFMVLAALIVYLFTACHLTDPGRRLWVLGWLLALALLNVGVGIRQFTNSDSYMLIPGMGRSTQYLGRASGLYICPDHLAGYLEVVALLALSILLWSRCRAWVKLLVGYCLLCCLIGHLLTVSRGGFLSLGVGLVTLLFLSLARARSIIPEKLPQLFAGALLVFVLAAGGLWYGVSKSTRLKGRATNLIVRDVRFLIWPAAVKQWQTAPVFGTGAETFVYYGRRFRDPAVQSDPINTHNDYLQFLGEYGLVGVAGLLLFLAAHLRWGWRAYVHLSLRSGDDRARRGQTGSNAAAWNIGAASAVAAIAAHSVVDFNLHIPVNTLLMAFVFGVLANPGRELPAASPWDVSPSTRPLPPDLLARLALPVLGIWLAVMGLPHLPGEYYAEQSRQALRDSKPLPALNFASEGLKHEHRNPLLFYYLGDSRQILADRIPNATASRSFLEASVEPYREGLKLYPYDTRLLLRLGSALTLLGQLDDAAPVFQKAMEWDPNFRLTYTYYGSYLVQRGRLTEAKAAYRHAFSLSGEPAAERNLEYLNNLNTAGSLNN